MSTRTEDPVDGLDAPVHVSASGVFHRVYAFFYHKKVGLSLIIVTGVLTLVGVLARQMPDSVRLDPAARAGWLQQTSDVYGGWTGPLDAIGFFSIFSSPLYLTVAALLAVSIVACTTHRLPQLIRNAFHPHTHVRPSFYRHARVAATLTSAQSPDAARDAVAQALRGRGYRVIPDPGGESLYADKFHWAPFGTAVAHAGYVVVMAGFLLSSFTGFRIESFELTVGIPREVGHGTSLTATAESFTDTYDEQHGTPIDYVTDLVVAKDGEAPRRQDVRVNDPLIVDGIYFHQASFGVSAVVRITKNNEVLFDGGVPLTWTSPDQRLRYGVVMVDGREVYVSAAASGTNGALPAGQVRVEVYPEGSNTPNGVATIDAGASATADGLSVEFVREQKYTSLIVKKDPGTPVVWAGFAMLIVGTCITMGLPHRRQWVRVTPGGEGTLIETATVDRPDTGRRRIFDDAVEAMSTAVNAAGGTTPSSPASPVDRVGSPERPAERNES